MQNPRVIKSKGRLKGALKNAHASKSKSDWSTERDFSQYELVESALLEDLSKLKRIYRSKNTGRLKNLKAILKVKPKLSPLKKQKRKQAETPEKTIIRITNRQRSKTTFFKCSSDEDEDPITIESGDDEAENKTEDEAEDEAENKTENEAEERISASRRSQRNIQLPVRYRD